MLPASGSLGAARRQYHPAVLSCQECDCVTEDALGWRGHVARDPDNPASEALLVLYCPVCAEREFCVSPRTEYT